MLFEAVDLYRTGLVKLRLASRMQLFEALYAAL